MDTGRPSFWKRGFTILFKGLVIAIALLAVLYAVVSFMAARREKAVREDWAQAGRPLDGFLASLQATAPNPTAQALEGVGNRLGIQRGEKKEPWLGVSVPLNDYLKAELGKDGPTVAGPPEAVAAFLRDQAPLITEVRKAVLDGPPPVWEAANRGFFQAPIPNLLQIINLQKVLATSALAALSRGDRDIALADLEAGWRIGEALGKRSETICALVSMAGLRLSAGVLRRVDGAPAAWRERLASCKPREGLERGYELEACAMLEVGRADAPWPFGTSPTRLQRLYAVLGRPYLRLSSASSAGTILDMVKTAQEAGPCPDGLEAKISEVWTRVPWWNWLGKIALPNLSSTWGRAFRFQLDLELTEKVLLAKAARAGNADVWPEEIPGLETSLCPGGRWSYARSPGGVAITYSSEPNFPEVRGSAVVLPLRYEEAITQANRETGPKK